MMSVVINFLTPTLSHLTELAVDASTLSEDLAKSVKVFVEDLLCLQGELTELLGASLHLTSQGPGLALDLGRVPFPLPGHHLLDWGRYWGANGGRARERRRRSVCRPGGC